MGRIQAAWDSRCVHGAAFVGVLALASAAWLAPTRVLAQPRSQGSASEAQDGEARLLFEAAKRAFADARYDTALARFREAYTLSARPALLYNIGQCADRLRRDDEALEAFDRYLAAMPDAPNAAEVRTRIGALRAAQARQAEAIAAARVGAAAPAIAPASSAASNPAAVATPSAPTTATPPAPTTAASRASTSATPPAPISATPPASMTPAATSVTTTAHVAPPVTVTPPPREMPAVDRVAPAAPTSGPAQENSADAPSARANETGSAPGEVATDSGGGAPTWAIVGTFVGVGVAAAGIVPAVLARGTRGELDALCDAERFCPGEAQSLVDRGSSEALAADVLFGVGGALAIGFGLAWWLVDGDDETPVTATAACDGRGCAVGVGGRF